MSTRRCRAALFFALFAAGCGGEAGTGVTIEITRDPQAPASHVELDWYDGERVVFRGRRVPARGNLPDGLVSVRVEVTSAVRGGMRRAVIRGMRGQEADPVAEGTGMVNLGTGGWRTMPVLVIAGRRPDRDGDSVPDEVDLCPDDPQRNGPCTEGEDGGAPEGDGAAPDGARADQAIADAGDAGGTDGADAGADQRPADAPDAAGPPDAAPDVARDGGAPPLDATTDLGPDGPRPIACGIVMLVTSGGTERGDTLVSMRLRDMGCTVMVRDDDAVATGDAAGKALIIISDTALPTKVTTKLRTVTVPVINMEPVLLDDMAMTGPLEGTDWARNLPQTHVAVLDAGHPLAGGLSGSVPLFADPDPIGWGRPDPIGSIRVASIVGNIAQLVIFAYDTGMPTATPGFVAPARRVAFNVNETAFAKLNASGWTLFDAAVRWALRVN